MSQQEAAAFVRACGVSDLKDGGAIGVVLGGDEIAIVKTEGEVFAIKDWCSHAAVPLSEGDVDGYTIECWLHGSCCAPASRRRCPPPSRCPFTP
jgi:3-phenylpropionate/trans-cinnamate dioxygenase ferredoxin subunit